MLDSLMLALTAIGRGGAIWLVIAIGGVLVRRARAMAMWQVGLALLLSLLVTDGILKPLVHEPRPFQANPHARVLGARPSGYSFPSGHASSSFAAAVSLARAWPAGAAAWFLLATLIAVSRVYLGVHSVLDVIGGALVGLACGYFAIGRSRWSRGRAPAE
jgi:undecaprenyl-diphosphatase